MQSVLSQLSLAKQEVLRLEELLKQITCSSCGEKEKECQTLCKECCGCEKHCSHEGCVNKVCSGESLFCVKPTFCEDHCLFKHHSHSFSSLSVELPEDRESLSSFPDSFSGDELHLHGLVIDKPVVVQDVSVVKLVLRDCVISKPLTVNCREVVLLNCKGTSVFGSDGKKRVVKIDISSRGDVNVQSFVSQH